MIERVCSQLREESPAFHRFKNEIILMDNHKWALYSWVQYVTNKEIHDPLSLFHADYHWDAVDDLHGKEEHLIQEFLTSDLISLRQLIRKNDCIRYDSFIAPAVRLGVINDIHWFCFQEDDDQGIYSEIFDKTQLVQTSYDDVQDVPVLELSKKKVIFDLCLDLFNRSNDKEYEGDLWEDQEIIDFLEVVSPMIVSAELVTVSLSFGCSGTEEDTVHLAKLVIPILEAYREKLDFRG